MHSIRTPVLPESSQLRIVHEPWKKILYDGSNRIVAAEPRIKTL